MTGTTTYPEHCLWVQMLFAIHTAVPYPFEGDEAGDRGKILPSFCSVAVLSYAEQVFGCNKDEYTCIWGDLGSLLVSPYQIVMFRHQERN